MGNTTVALRAIDSNAEPDANAEYSLANSDVKLKRLSRFTIGELEEVWSPVYYFFIGFIRLDEKLAGSYVSQV